MTRLNGRVPLLGQQMSREDQAKLQILQGIHHLSLTIYARMCEHLPNHLDLNDLKIKAKNARMAAEAYYEAMIEPK